MTARQLLRFAVVGGTTAAAYYALLFAGVEGLGLPPTWVSSLAFVIVICFNYLLHYRWTFAADMPHRQSFSRFLAMNAVGFCLNATVMVVGIGQTSLHYAYVQAAAIALVIAWNLLASATWVYRT